MISIHTPHAGSDRKHRMRQGRREKFQSTLPMRGATYTNPRFGPRQMISIHTPHAGSDLVYAIKDVDLVISIHTPHAGSDTEVMAMRVEADIFQSTLPMRGATGRDLPGWTGCRISIHTPHAGSDNSKRDI